jgi:hypothetical protein
MLSDMSSLYSDSTGPGSRSLSEILEKYIALLQPRKMASIYNHEQCRVRNAALKSNRFKRRRDDIAK